MQANAVGLLFQQRENPIPRGNDCPELFLDLQRTALDRSAGILPA